MENLLTYKEAARILKRQPTTLRQDVSKGRIPHVKIFGQVRFRESDLEQFINDHVIKAG